MTKPDSPLWTNRARPIPELAWLADVDPADIAAAAKAIAEDPEIQAEIARRIKPYHDGDIKHRQMRRALGLFG